MLLSGGSWWPPLRAWGSVEAVCRESLVSTILEWRCATAQATALLATATVATAAGYHACLADTCASGG